MTSTNTSEEINNTPKSKNVKPEAKRKKKHNYTSFNTYIYKVLKQVHPDTGITKKSMNILDSFVVDIFNRLLTEAAKLARMNKRATISAREVQAAVRLVIPGELAKHAISEGTKAVVKFNSSQTEQ